jgi:hypothetical protein
MLLAMGAALLMEMLDRRVRTNADAYESLGVPLLGVLPGTASARRGRGGPPLLQHRILGQLPRPAEGA